MLNFSLIKFRFLQTILHLIYFDYIHHQEILDFLGKGQYHLIQTEKFKLIVIFKNVYGLESINPTRFF